MLVYVICYSKFIQDRHKIMFANEYFFLLFLNKCLFIHLQWTCVKIVVDGAETLQDLVSLGRVSPFDFT